MSDLQSPLSTELGVLKIYLEAFSINENVFRQGVHKVDIKIGHELNFNTEDEIAKFTLKCVYIYKENSENILDIDVATVFSFKGLKQFLLTKGPNTGRVDLPRPILISCLSIALSHSRVILFQNISNTIYAGHLPLPIFNPTQLADILFPQQIEEVQIKKIKK